MVTEKGEIINLEQLWDSATCKYFWSATITFNDKPKLILDNCEVKQ